MKGILKIAVALLAFLFVTNACDVEKEPYIQGADSEKAILEFSVGDHIGRIDKTTKSVMLDFEAGTDVSHLVPTIVVSPYATIEPESGVAQDFTELVYYTVTAFDGSQALYMVMATVHDAENEKSILSFTLEGVEGEINELAKTVTALMPEGTDITHLAPAIEVSEGATVNPASGVAQDFTHPVEYTVTAQNGTTAVYTVTVNVEGGEVVPTGKTVLLKDFTGVRCVNCPAAAEYAHNLQHQLDEDRIVIMSVHAGFLAQPVGNFPDFTTEEGTLWYGNNNSNPLFAVDRVALTEGNTLFVEQLDTPVSEALEEEQTFEIVVKPHYDEGSEQLDVDIEAVALTEMEGRFYVTACLVEDNIVGWQTTPNGVDQQYVFHNVFRGTLNGADGEQFSETHLNPNQTVYFHYSTQIGVLYDPEECYLVVYVYDKSQDSKILQTTMKKIQ